MKTRGKRRSNALQLAIAVLLMACIVIVRTQPCYSDVRFPRLIAQEGGQSEVWMTAIAKVEGPDAVFIGGYTNGKWEMTGAPADE